jgi:hypothetical protein
VLAASAATGVVAGVTVANRLGDLSQSLLAATPRAVGDGRVWLLLGSAAIADRPAVPSLVGFWVVALATLLVCSARLCAGVAVAGHVLSALGVYGVIGLARVADPGAFASVVQLPDYGLSAIIAAWLGAIARVLWTRYPAWGWRVLVALGSAGCAGIGLALRPDVTFLDTEHLLAFAIGAALVERRLWSRLARPSRRFVAATATMVLPGRGA